MRMRNWLVLAALALLPSLAEAQQPWQRGALFSCGINNIGATLTEITGCAAIPASLLEQRRYYIGTIAAQSTTATAGLFTLRSGTGTNCGTGTVNLLGNVATASVVAPANTLATSNINFDPPLAVPAGHAICVLGVATNTTSITLTGYIAP